MIPVVVAIHMVNQHAVVVAAELDVVVAEVVILVLKDVMVMVKVPSVVLVVVVVRVASVIVSVDFEMDFVVEVLVSKIEHFEFLGDVVVVLMGYIL